MASKKPAAVAAVFMLALALYMYLANTASTPLGASGRATSAGGAPATRAQQAIGRLYVVGPAWLGDVAARRLNVSVEAIQLGDLPAVPNGSVVLIYWPYLKANRSSLRYLESAIARGDLIAVYGNASDEAEAEYLLGYAWAKASNNRAINGAVWPGTALPDYLFAVPLIPVGSEEPVLYVVKWIKPRGLVIGPIYLDQPPKLVARLGTDPATGPDPCLNEYKNFPKLATPSAGTYVSDSNFPNYFEDITPAAVILPNFSPSNSYNAVFAVDFDNYVYTSTVAFVPPAPYGGICYYYTTENIWARVYWAI